MQEQIDLLSSDFIPTQGSTTHPTMQEEDPFDFLQSTTTTQLCLTGLFEFFGLYEKGKAVAIPLKEISVEGVVTQDFANIKYSQKYYNQSDLMLEAEYFFPISSTACYDSFRAKIGKKVIEGVIKEKSKAKQEYHNKLKSGDTVAYAEINEETSDIMKVMIGNIPPKTEIDIEFSFIDKVDVSMNKFRRYTLFSTIVPRYNSNPKTKDAQTLANYPIVNYSGTYPWKINLMIVCDEEITFAKSSSHVNCNLKKISPTIYEVQLNNEKPNKDFTILFSSGNFQEIHSQVSPFKYGYCGFVKFFPELNNMTLDDAYVASLEGRDPGENPDIVSAKGEFIFLIDRSGSMMGKRIDKAKEALIYFIKSLPMDSYFNIVSFGTNYEFLSVRESLRTNDQNIKQALQSIGMFNANMNGTEILQPLQKVFNMPLISGYQRNVFLLTDGEVSNTNDVLNLIERNRDRSRLFTLGIGTGASTQLIRSGALKGRGKSEFVQDRESVSDRVISLLKCSILPCITDITIKFQDPELVCYSIPDKESLSIMVANEVTDLFIIFNKTLGNKKKTKLEIKYYDALAKLQKTIPITLEIRSSQENKPLVKYGMYRFIKELEEKKQYSLFKGKGEADSQLEQDLKNRIPFLSAQFGILCKETAFICTLREGDDASRQIPTEKVIVPQTRSYDSHLDLFGFSQSSSSDLFGYAAGPSLQKNALLFDDCLFFMSNESQQLQPQQKPSSDKNLLNFGDFSFSPSKPSSNQPMFLLDMEDEFESKVGKEEKEVIQHEAAQKYPMISTTTNEITSQPFSFEEKKSNDLLPMSGFSGATKRQSPPANSQMMSVITKQMFSGYWEADSETFNILSISENSFKNTIPSALSGNQDSNTIWITILTIIWLEQFFMASKSTWELIKLKSTKWLATKKVNYLDHYEAALKCLGI